MSSYKRPTLYEAVNIGGTYYPALPPNVMQTIPDVWNGGRLGRSPLFGGRVPRANGPLVRLPLSEFPQAEDLRRFGKAQYQPRPYGMPSRMVAPTMREFLKRGAGRLNFMFDLYEIVQDVSQMVEPAEVTHVREYPESPDRYSWYMPAGWDYCSFTPGFQPGLPSAFGTFELYGIGTNDGAGPGSNCATYGGPYFQEGVGYLDDGRRYLGYYTADEHGGPGEAVPWIVVSENSVGTEEEARFYVSPKGQDAVDKRVYSSAYPRTPPLTGLDPSLRPIGIPSGFPRHLPWHMLPKRKRNPFFNFDNGTQTGSSGARQPPPNLPYIPNPTRPPMGTKERKRKWAGMGVLAASKAALNGTLETCDAISAVWDALPRDVKWSPGLGRGKNCADKARDLFTHFDKLDIDEALVNLAKMYIEDKLYGKVFATTDKAGRNLSKHGMKVPGWKIDQPVMNMENPLSNSGLLQDIEGALFGLIKGAI